ncbi:E2 domain-associated cysteine-rich protein [Pelagerythrobacter aerophilus]|uniref:Uncharacterized protein n=1 Tax=Pelagerythrobacter aerophilus TaxID=2306995 RepID=A0A418NI15_9SPHN|nr:E2 domain-associated cysteine-rich protein [Pelagerythrobacter aerophilus]RIV78608.1 hypothetical protein D2V04_07325 [Pelagerythrobacter aerophilus]
MSPSDDLDIIASCAAEFGAVEIARTRLELKVQLPVPLADGRSHSYRLVIAIFRGVATAQEEKPHLLPEFCPARHINRDGSFCLFWRAVDDIVIDNVSAARMWWETLIRFLQQQVRAARLRHWPDAKGRAHGEKAAIHQLRAERAAGRLGAPFPEDLADGRLIVEVSNSSGHGPAVRLLHNGRRLYSVWRRDRRVVNQRQPCLCPKGAQRRPIVLKSCGDHGGAAADLALELQSMAEEERRFWNDFESTQCCGTMDGCPLAKRESSVRAERVG